VLAYAISVITDGFREFLAKNFDADSIVEGQKF